MTDPIQTASAPEPDSAGLVPAARLTSSQLASLFRAIDDVLEDWYCNDPDFHREFSSIENDLLQALDEARDVFRVAMGQGDLLQ